jgi:ABC-type branched-subunit amino acid transport system permease subunit
MTRAAAIPAGLVARLVACLSACLADRWRIAAVVGCAGLLALPPFVAGGFALHLLTTGFYYTIMAASWNLLAGFTGQFSLAHHAFAAIGAYTSGLLIRYYAVPLWVGILSGGVLAAALGFVLGRLVLAMRAIYLAIATWAFAETTHILLTAAYPITRGELGLNVRITFSSRASPSFRSPSCTRSSRARSAISCARSATTICAPKASASTPRG